MHLAIGLGELMRVDHFAAEDNLNISLKDITVTGRDGRVSQLDQVYIRGSMVRFFIVPDMLQNAPMCVHSFFFSFQDSGMILIVIAGSNAWDQML
jgi:hypothetical protein